MSDVIGNYKLSKPELVIRTGLEVFTISKGHKIEVTHEDLQHGNILINYGDNRFSWKHISVLKDFRRIDIE